MMLLEADDIRYLGRKYEIKINTFEDIPKLVSALEHYHQFETAKGYQFIYDRLRECVEWEFIDDTPSEITTSS